MAGLVKQTFFTTAISHGHPDSAVEQDLDFLQPTNPACWSSESPGARPKLTPGLSPPFFRRRPTMSTPSIGCYSF